MLEIDIRGTEEMQKVFEEIAPRDAENLMRATVGGVAGEIRKEARKTVLLRRRILKKAIKVKRQRTTVRGHLRADVIVEARAFYWRYMEYGTRAGVQASAPFLHSMRAIEARLPAMLREQFRKKLIAAVKRAIKRQGGS